MKNKTADEEDFLKARVADAVRLASSGGKPRFVGFLNESEAKRAANLFSYGSQEHTLFWGGHPDAERVFFGAFPDFSEPDAKKFPIDVLTAVFRKQDRLSHRDFLGALLHAGLERSSLGDILTEEGRAVIFCKHEVSNFLCTQVEKIGGAGVHITVGADEPFPAAHHFADFSSVVASPRLDCLVAAAVRTSREKAAEMIQSKLVELNHESAASTSETVSEGDVLSVHGEGRFIIDRLGPLTKKGRLGVSGRKFV